MKKLIALFPCVALSLAVGAFGVGCACKDKCDSSSACCDGTADCCKEGGECKDGDKAKTTPAAATPAAQSAAPVNKICPIGGHDADPKLTAAYQGKTIAFCCDDCKQEFLGMDDKGKAALFAKASGN